MLGLVYLVICARRRRCQVYLIRMVKTSVLIRLCFASDLAFTMLGLLRSSHLASPHPSFSILYLYLG